MSTAPDPLDLLSNTQCANERQGALLEAISDKMHDALHEMAAGEARERELYHCWMLLTTAQENHATIDRQFHEAESGILGTGLAKAIRGQAGKTVTS